ncbi:protein SHORT HYPOCOTYL IN WHITE LIGHT 1 isoform X2 [Cajanus cajan]|uniref:protein SHORT HYPOCOTYL IN WHITE LIGHT 1 isoform X2 n=1 Tax=Cajanus cajan TaxID=3821 RepID=UPI00098DD19F|nr:protein SHORT HYPOCOTYL IN WHITE LIGHT 1 isoform X2 [Cajanus cajan]
MSFTVVTVKSAPLSIPWFRSHNRLGRIALSTHHASNSSQRVSCFSLSQSRNNFAHGPRTWMLPIRDDDDDDDDDENEEDRSWELLGRFVQNVFKKVSKRARKAVRSVLPFPISTHLVRFSVNGILMLTFLWIFKIFLEVLCTLGSVVFVSILLIRGIWSGVSFLQENRRQKMDELDMPNAWKWNGAQPVT